MNKFALILGMVFTLSASSVMACEDFQCAPAPKQKLSISNVVGVNPLAEKIANAIVTKQIKKEAKGKFSSKIESYNIKSLKQGIFKSLEINGRDVEAEGIYVSTVKFKTICDYNHIVYNDKDNSLTFKENFAVAYAVQFTEDDLNRTIANSSYGDLIRKINGIGNAYKIFNIASNSVSIKDDALYYNLRVVLFNMKQDISIKTDFKVRNGEIVLNDANISSGVLKLDVNRLNKLINYLNPLEFSMNLFENKNANMQIKEMTISDDKINISGIVTVDKDVVMY